MLLTSVLVDYCTKHTEWKKLMHSVGSYCPAAFLCDFKGHDFTTHGGGLGAGQCKILFDPNLIKSSSCQAKIKGNCPLSSNADIVRRQGGTVACRFCQI